MAKRNTGKKKNNNKAKANNRQSEQNIKKIINQEESDTNNQSEDFNQAVKEDTADVNNKTTGKNGKLSTTSKQISKQDSKAMNQIAKIAKKIARGIKGLLKVAKSQINKKNIPILLGIIVGILSFCVVAATIFSVKTYKAVSYMAQKQIEEDEANIITKENDVIISERYKIKDTTDISDAYKTGNTKGLDKKQKEVMNLAADIIKSVTDEKMSDYEKEKAIYDWMCENIGEDKGMLTVVPTSSKDSDNPYGTLKFRQAVCVGYATTFRLFMNMMGIDCMVVHNTDLFHSWNLVKLDGHWYHTDVYTDSETGDYSHFNMSDSMRCADLEWDTGYFPAADSLKYNMAYRNMEEVENVYEMPDIIRKEMNDGITSFCIRYKGKVDNEVDGIIRAMITSLDDALISGNLEDLPYSFNTYSWIRDEETGGYLYWITLNKNGVDGVANLTDKQKRELQKAVDKAFGDKLSVYISDEISEEVPEGDMNDSTGDENQNALIGDYNQNDNQGDGQHGDDYYAN
ncbi:MAG: transglutaminase-like domain-containing protein [Lachnospiraceae bacterium]|nr:transglutaminase-like domain-containing protein [Lachnospiraceae bacterium]